MCRAIITAAMLVVDIVLLGVVVALVAIDMVRL